MGTLSDLGLATGDGSLLLIEPPDAVLAEAGSLTPRPGVASTLQVARPAARIAWWPEADQLGEGRLSRLAWMVGVAEGHAWIIAGMDDDAPTAAALRDALKSSAFRTTEERALEDGSTAFRVVAGG